MSYGIHLDGEGLTPERRAEALVAQREWAEKVAQGIERGELPAEQEERRMLAAILRSAADLPERPRKRRGRPGKLPDDDTAVIMVRMLELRGKSHPAALRKVAESFGMLDESRLAKLCRERGAAVDRFFRGAIVLGKGRRNSRE